MSSASTLPNGIRTIAKQLRYLLDATRFQADIFSNSDEIRYFLEDCDDRLQEIENGLRSPEPDVESLTDRIRKLEGAFWFKGCAYPTGDEMGVFLTDFQYKLEEVRESLGQWSIQQRFAWKGRAKSHRGLHLVK